MDAADTYKRQKEAWVHGLSGGSPVEIVAITLLCVFAVYAYNYVLERGVGSRLSRSSVWDRVGLEALLIVAPMLLACTTYAAWAPLIPLLAIAVGDYMSAAVSPVVVAVQTQPSSTSLAQIYEFTVFRACMMLYTIIAILAVDFPVFPRRFAKVETFGMSLMDTGVGGFVFSMGAAYALRRARIRHTKLITATDGKVESVAVSRPASRLRRSSSRVSLRGQQSPQVRHKSVTVTAKHHPALPGFSIGPLLRSSAPLLLLGGVRMALVKATDYQEHVSEYGVHWNFFFTLGLLPPVIAAGEWFLDRFVLAPAATVAGDVDTAMSSDRRYPLAGLLLGAFYQVSLSVFGLQHWILTAPRTDLLPANKEGICSLFGFASIFFFGAAAGEWIHRLSTLPPAARKQMTRDMLHLDMLLWTLYTVGSASLELETSRRLANAMYILFVVACSVLVLVALFATSTSDAGNAPLILRAINYNSLAIFLLANLCTGLVNHSMYTLFTGDAAALLVLVLYLGTVCGTAVVLHERQIHLRL